MSEQMRRLVAWGFALLLALLPLLTAVQPAQAAPPRQAYTFEECSRADAAAIQAEMEAMALAVLTEAGAGLDVDSLVARTWSDLGVGLVLDQEVDAAIARLQQDTAYWDRFLSGWSAQQAEALASQAATAAFDGPVFQAKVEEMATALAAGLVAEMEAHAARSASSALLCLQSYVGEHYSDTLFRAFESRIGQELAPAVAAEGTAPVTVAPVDLHLKALSGVGVIIAAQLTRKIALSLSQRIAGRLAGKIAGRVLGRIGTSVIPYLGWIVGAGLIVWDLVEGSQGALPQIRLALQAEEVKQEVRAEIAAAVREGLQAEVQTIAAGLAGTLVGQWQQWCTDHGELCALAAEDDALRLLLDATPVDQLARLASLVNLFLTDLDRAQLDASLADGSFEGLLALPAHAEVVLRATRSPQTVLAWAALAGQDFERMVDRGLYALVDPEQLSPAAFAVLMVIEDNDVIHKLLALAPEHLEVLVQLPIADLQVIAAATSAGDLAWLSAYLAGKTAAEARRIGAQVAAGTITLAALQTPPTPLPAAAPSDQTPAGSAAALPGAAGEDVGSPAGAAAVGGFHLEPSSLTTNSVLVAAGLVLLLVVVFGIVLSIRRNSYSNPG